MKLPPRLRLLALCPITRSTLEYYRRSCRKSTVAGIRRPYSPVFAGVDVLTFRLTLAPDRQLPQAGLPEAVHPGWEHRLTDNWTALRQTKEVPSKINGTPWWVKRGSSGPELA